MDEQFFARYITNSDLKRGVILIKDFYYIIFYAITDISFVFIKLAKGFAKFGFLQQ